MTLLELARHGRRHPTRGEHALWQALRGHALSTKFRRQCVMAPYIVDFVSHEARLIVEVDGPHHDLRRDADVARQRFLERSGYRFLRFSADDATTRTTDVVAAIARALAPKPD